MNEIQRVKGYKYCEDTLKLTETIEESFLVLGERLARIRDEELYLSQWDSFPEFLEEAKMSESGASKLINIYKKFIVEYQIPREKVIAARQGNLGEVLHYAYNKKMAVELVEDATILSRIDLKKKLTELRTGLAMEKCDHDWIDVHFRQCRKCQEREKIYSNN